MDQTREALRKAQSGGVKQFAHTLATDHAAAEARLSEPREHDGNHAAGERGDCPAQGGRRANPWETFGPRVDSDFDKLYIDAQVSEYAQVLELLDNRLIRKPRISI